MSTSSKTEEPANSISPPNEENETRQLSKDTIYHLLQVQRRRFALHYLQETTEPVVMSDLAEQVAAWEHGTTIGNLQSKERQRAYISLYQSHLPKLDEKGVIEYDQARGIVKRTGLTTHLDPYLTTCQTRQEEMSEGGTNEDSEPDTAPIRRWLWCYYSGVVVSCSLLLLTVFGVPAEVGLSGQLVLTAIILLFAVITVGYHISQYRQSKDET
ncbi:hypothetical protein [Haladaptatus sp. DYF46]|uniref:DUF7344 domain-containing protein n=1 Tax=Haladaptatus sp. DYF46 TaxID=2886041 RepID=UPI001E4A854B|nr:hypothetical protein [Haladaptatus sp. DYF46]